MMTPSAVDDHPSPLGQPSASPPISHPGPLEPETEVAGRYGEESGTESIRLRAGDLVAVDARTWANINQPGGVARITSVFRSSDAAETAPKAGPATPREAAAAVFVSVRYVIDGRHERKVDARYVRPYRLHSAGERFRDRSVLLGRCTYCGSLRSDCGSCDQHRMISRQQQQLQGGAAVIPRAAASRRKKDSRRKLASLSSQSSSSSGSVVDASDSSSSKSLDLDTLVARQRKIDRMFAKLQVRRRRWLSLSGRSVPDALGDRRRKKDPIREQQRRRRKRGSDPDRQPSSDDGTLSSQSSSLSRQGSNGYVSNQGEVEEGSSDSDPSSSSPFPTVRSDQRGEKAPESDGSPYNDRRDEVGQQEDVLFVQPEGSADELPKDVLDQTTHLRYEDLPKFFDDRVRSIRQQLRSAKRELRELERRIQPRDEQDVTISPREWRPECLAFHDKLVENLVRDGTDQCNRALRKLSSKRRFEQYLQRESASARTDVLGESEILSKQDLQLDSRGFQLDSVSVEVEDVVRRALTLIRQVDSDDEYPDDAISDDAGWVFPSSTSSSSSTPRMSDFAGSSGDELSLSLSPSPSLGPFDPHMHAARKRKNYQKGPVLVHHPSTRKRAALPLRGQRSGKAPISVLASRVEERDVLKSGYRIRATKRSRRGKRAERDGDRLRLQDGLSEIRNTQMGQVRLTPSKKRTLRSDPHLDRHRDVQGISNASILRVAQGEREGRTTQRDPIESTLDRMERFLEVNKEHCGESVEGPLGDPLHQGSTSLLDDSHLAPGRRYRVSRRRRIGAQTARPVESSVDMLTVLFWNLDRPKDIDVHGSVNSRSYDLGELHLQFSNTFPSDESVSVMCNIVATFKAAPVHDPTLTPKTFDLFLWALRSHGLETLTSLASRSNGAVRTRIHLLASILDLIRMGAHLLLMRDDGDAYVFFSRDKCNIFIELVVLQLVDLTYALLHPTAWGLGFSEQQRLNLLSELRPILTALSSVTDLLDKISRCIMNEHSCQNWYMSLDNRHALITSVNPRLWSGYLMSGEVERSIGESRLKSFGTVLPRLEIDTIWCLLALFGAHATSTPNVAVTNTQLYWRLVEKLFVNGVFRHDKEDVAVGAPNPSQLLTANTEIRRLTKLLIANATPALPEKDSFMTSIVQRTLLLAASAVEQQSENAAFDFPRLLEEKAAKNSSKAFWKRVFLICNSRDVRKDKMIASNLVKGLFAGNEAYSLGEISLAPSEVVSSCCGLVLAWTDRLPFKKARRARLHASIKSLIKEISSKITFLNQAHSTDFAPSSGLLSDAAVSRSDVLLLEATVLLTIFSRLLDFNQGQACSSMRRLAEEVWNQAADPSLDIRQHVLLDGSQSLPPRQFYSPMTASGTRIFIAAKTATSLSLLVLGSEAWTSRFPSNFFISYIPEDAVAKDDLAYLMSCLSSCLSCACDDETVREVAISVASMMGLVISRASQVLNAADGRVHRRCLECVDHLRSEAHSLILSTLMHSIDRALSSTSCSAVEALLLDSLLKLLQMTAMFIRIDNSSARRPVFNQPTPSVDGDTDPWGGVDDVLFAGLDLSIADTERAQQVTEVSEMWRKLLLLVDEAKPSERFSIRGTNNLSSQARNLVARHQASLSRSLAHVVAAEGETACKQLFSRLAKSISAASSSCITNEEHHSLDDASYFKSCTFRVVTELVSISVSSKAVATAVSGSASIVVMVLLDKSLDVHLIEGLPSSNLERIRASSGEDGVKIELARLFELSGTRKRRTIEETKKLWRSVASLGRCFLRGEHATRLYGLANCFVNLDGETFDLRHNLSPFTLESECFRRLCLFQGVVSSDALDLAAVIAAFCSGSAAGLAKLDTAFARWHQCFDPGAQSSSKDHEFAKMLEVVDCYCCFQVTVTSWILLQRSSSCSPDDMSLLRSLGDMFVKRYLQRKPVVVDSGPGLANAPTRRLNDLCLRTIQHCYQDFLVFSAQEYSRSGETNPGSLFEALVTVALEGSDEGAYRFCRSFYTKVGRPRTLVEDPAHSSPLQAAIEKLRERLQATNSGHSAELLKLKCFLLTKVIAPRLCVNQAESIKQGLLRMVRYVLEMEAIEGHDLEDLPKLDVQTLVMVVRGIRFILQNALTSSSVSDELVSSVYHCVSALRNLPCASVDGPGVGPLLLWTRVNRPEAAAYFQAFFDCVRDLGERIKNSGRNSEHMEQYLAQLRELKSNHWVVAPELLTRPVVPSWERLFLTERRACPVMAASVSRPVPVNVYASRQGGPQRGESRARRAWVPSSELRRVANEFLAKSESLLQGE